MFQLVIDVQKEKGAGGVGTLKDGGQNSSGRAQRPDSSTLMWPLSLDI